MPYSIYIIYKEKLSHRANHMEGWAVFCLWIDLPEKESLNDPKFTCTMDCWEYLNPLPELNFCDSLGSKILTKCPSNM